MKRVFKQEKQLKKFILFRFYLVIIIVVCIFADENKHKKIILNLFDMIQKIKEIGEFNAWRGFIGLYLTTKEVRSLKKFGITSETTIKEAYKILTK